MSVTDSKAIRDRVEKRKQAAVDAERTALVRVLTTSEGRRVWLLIRNEFAMATKAIQGADALALARRAGRDDVAVLMDEKLRALDTPEVRIALAREQAEIDANDIAHEADLRRLEAEEKAHGR